MQDSMCDTKILSQEGDTILVSFAISVKHIISGNKVLY
jgi:hypothetical protein